MQVIRQRIVDGVDVGVAQQFFVRSVRFGNAESRAARRALPTSREAIATISVPCLLHGGYYLLKADCGHTQNAPANFGHVKEAFQPAENALAGNAHSTRCMIWS